MTVVEPGDGWTDDQPKPGSDVARIHGCTCPVLDNGHGAGYLGNGELYGWVVSMDCPLHAPRTPIDSR